MTRHLVILLPLVLGLPALFVTAGATEKESPPNFLFIFVDDQSWSGTSVAMIPGRDFSRTAEFHMPNLERLASQGMTFSQAYASHPKCECSRAAILMGRTTTSLNAIDKRSRNWNAPPRDSLANTLKRAQPTYRAAHFGKWQWPQTPQSMGYDASDGITMNEDGDTSDPNDPKQSFGLTRRAVAYMEQQVQTNHPFFLQLSYYAVHAKPQALAETLRKYTDRDTNGTNNGGRSSEALMAAMTEDLDTCIGVLVAKLEQLGIAQNTFVIYMSDNGGRSAALKGGKALLDEGGLRVPLIVSGPGIQGTTYCNEPVVGYDLLPTILDYASPGYELPLGVEGGSWKTVLANAGNGNIRRPIDRLVFHHDVEIEHPQSALRKGNLKLLHYWDTKQSFLYDLSKDLSETHDLSNEQPETVNQLLAELKNHIRLGLGEQKFASLESGDRQDSDSGGKSGSGKGKGKGSPGTKKRRSPTSS